MRRLFLISMAFALVAPFDAASDGTQTKKSAAELREERIKKMRESAKGLNRQMTEVCLEHENASTSGVPYVAQGKLLSRVKGQADAVCAAYGEAWRSFYDLGFYKKLMTVSLDARPDGTPNIVLDEKAGKLTVTLRLSVHDENYNAWKETVHKRFADANMSHVFSDFEDAGGRMIGGKNYRFGENEEAAIKRWEAENAVTADLTIRVRLLDGNGRVIKDDFIPMERFARPGYNMYPYPLCNLNRLSELPRPRYCWVSGGEDKNMTRLEDAYAKVDYVLCKADMGALVEVKCDIMDDADAKLLDGDDLKRWRRRVRPNGRTSKKTLTDAEIQKGLNIGYKQGRTGCLAAGERQLGYSLIKAALEAKWDRPAWKDSLRPMVVRIWFGNGGRIVDYKLESGSGDVQTDQSIKSAVTRVGSIPMLPRAFIEKYKNDGVPVRFVVKPQ